MFTIPDMSQEAEMSSYDQKASEIFKLILEDGEPKTSYDLIFKKNQPTATVHRHLNRMLKENQIVVYGEKHLRKKKPYGPTLYGIISFYGMDDEFTEKLENYFDQWKNNPDFRAALVEMGFDEKKMKKFPEKCRKMFRRWIEFCAMCEEAYDKLAEDPYILTYELQQFIGGLLLAIDKNKKAQQLNEELYAFSEPYRKATDMATLLILARHKAMREKAKSLMKKWE